MLLPRNAKFLCPFVSLIALFKNFADNSTSIYVPKDAGAWQREGAVQGA